MGYESNLDAYDTQMTNALTKNWKQLPDPPLLMLLPSFVHVGREGTMAMIKNEDVDFLSLK